MKRLIQAAAVMSMVLLAACGGVTPRATPTAAPTADGTSIALRATRTPLPLSTLTQNATVTLRPTHTNTPLPTDTASATQLLTLTFTPSPTQTPTASTTITPIASATSPATQTLRPTIRPSVTALPTQTNTPLPTLTPTLRPTTTPIPTVTPFFSPTPPPSLTPPPDPSQTVTPAPTATPLPTLTPTLDGTRIADALRTQQALTPRSTWTPVPPASPTRTLVSTLDVTPTLITATPGADNIGIRQTPVISTPQIATNAPTVTLIPTALPLLPTTVPILTQTPNFPPRPFGGLLANASLQAGTFNFVPGSFTFNDQAVTGGVALFAANPRFGESYARVDQAGNLAFVAPGASGEGVIPGSPFFQGQPPATDATTNADRVTQISWSPDGTKLAFMIYGLPGTDNGDAGVWVWNGSEAINHSHDCPDNSNYQRACDLNTDKPTDNYVTTHIQWRADSAAMLNLYSTQWNGRPKRGFAVVPISGVNSTLAPRIWFYDSAAYMNDGRILVSGEAPDGQWVVGIMGVREDGQPNVDADNPVQVLLDADAAGVWVDSAVQRPDGVIVAFGRVGQADGPLALGIVTNQTWTALGPSIGDSYPQRIAWGSTYEQAVVTVGGQQVVVSAYTGSVQPLIP